MGRRLWWRLAHLEGHLVQPIGTSHLGHSLGYRSVVFCPGILAGRLHLTSVAVFPNGFACRGTWAVLLLLLFSSYVLCVTVGHWCVGSGRLPLVTYHWCTRSLVQSVFPWASTGPGAVGFRQVPKKSCEIVSWLLSAKGVVQGVSTTESRGIGSNAYYGFKWFYMVRVYKNNLKFSSGPAQLFPSSMQKGGIQRSNYQVMPNFWVVAHQPWITF